MKKGSTAKQNILTFPSDSAPSWGISSVRRLWGVSFLMRSLKWGTLWEYGSLQPPWHVLRALIPLVTPRYFAGNCECAWHVQSCCIAGSYCSKQKSWKDSSPVSASIFTNWYGKKSMYLRTHVLSHCSLVLKLLPLAAHPPHRNLVQLSPSNQNLGIDALHGPGFTGSEHFRGGAGVQSQGYVYLVFPNWMQSICCCFTFIPG